VLRRTGLEARPHILKFYFVINPQVVLKLCSSSGALCWFGSDIRFRWLANSWGVFGSGAKWIAALGSAGARIVGDRANSGDIGCVVHKALWR